MISKKNQFSFRNGAVAKKTLPVAVVGKFIEASESD